MSNDDTLKVKREFLKLPMEERRRVLKKQAEELAASEVSNDDLLLTKEDYLKIIKEDYGGEPIPYKTVEFAKFACEDQVAKCQAHYEPLITEIQERQAELLKKMNDIDLAITQAGEAGYRRGATEKAKEIIQWVDAYSGLDVDGNRSFADAAWQSFKKAQLGLIGGEKR